MKRSEMLKVIADHIQKYDFGGELAKLSYDQSAEHFLSKLEELGMTPPAIPYDTWYVNQWEDENE